MMSLRSIAIIGAAVATAHAASAQNIGPSSPAVLTYARAQEQLLDRSDAIAASDANVRSKEAQEGATRTLRRPDVDLEAQLLDYQTTL